jgi:hypothetical protein
MITFDGYLEQIDYQDGMIRGLHLVDRGTGERWLIKLDPPEREPTIEINPGTGPFKFLSPETRPPVTIEREWR